MTTPHGDFSPQAEAYARARPAYPPAVVARLLERAGVNQSDPVVDLGAGTGLFTRELCLRRLHVTAIEPSAAMREQNVAPEATWMEGTFAGIALPNESQAWAVAAQAFHWAQPVRALPEIHRVLRRGAKFSVCWNQRRFDQSEVVARARELIHARAPGFDEGYRDKDWGEVLASTGHFVDPQLDEVDHVVPMSRERFLDLWRSHNKLHGAIGCEGVAQLIDTLADEIPEDRVLDIPYRCRAYTVRRRDGAA